ncbi:CinA family nicotinamide mononucleotide deamidase-related protein [Sediminibacterium ginsengisoli]|uniref:CinA-like protein n=1 Tax=Sediminibacterium ginsengisoli TaxID=413434 RepID=A0A1T4PLH1_9BACT|nr:CinA family nicotinamide mononucleotide deamidase-related protein [Sediminibacterium ginsengisoli]SJZ92342.1 nicotinamide-nucleotide amidase [Sediminibacterium ginsengisoli]
MEKVFASIITIGDELLIGQVIDTNSAWIARELNKRGMPVKNRVAVGDNRDDIWQALDNECGRASLVLITGGLGPTADDITKPLLADYFGGKMVIHETTLQHVIHLFESVFKRPVSDRNKKQAEVPDSCTVLFNESGTAPGMLFEKNGTVFISMPGVPHEMKWLMEHHVLPMISSRFATGFIAHRTLLTAGIGESMLADLIADLEADLPGWIKLAYLPNYGMVRLRLTASGMDKDLIERELSRHFDLLVSRTAEYLVAAEDIPLELAIGRLLQEKGKTMATAESCTGGYIAHLITAHAGSSAYYKGTVVSYANDVKEHALHVKPETLAAFGAVSEDTVREMVQGTLSLIGSDYAVAVSGIMGPDGGTPEKPVGMVWIAAGNAEKTIARQFRLRFDRQKNIEVTAVYALNLLRLLILEKS